MKPGGWASQVTVVPPTNLIRTTSPIFGGIANYSCPLKFKPPCISIVFLNARLLPTARFHGTTFRVLEVHDHLELTDALELHLIELPKLGLRDEDPRLARWVRFFLADSEAEFQELAMNDADMRRAKDALEQLSQDPGARELAHERELARANEGGLQDLLDRIRRDHCWPDSG